MPYTTGVFLLRLSLAGVGLSARETTGNFNLALRFLSGIYSGGGGLDTSGSKRKSLKPRRDVRFVDDKGFITEAWDRYFSDLDERRLGGILAPTLPQVAVTVSESQTATAGIAGTLTNITQSVEANAAGQAAIAEVLSASVAVATISDPPAAAAAAAAAVAAATQIPPPVLTVPVYVPPPKPSGPNQVLE